MTSNIHSIDRILRFALALAFLILYFGDFIQGTLGLVLAIAGGVFALTGLINFCPLYKVLGISTKK